MAGADHSAVAALATALIAESRPIIRQYFRQSPDIQRKADETPVTIADKTVETALCAKIRLHFPDHSIIGEEHGQTDNASPYTWVIDPIDGTTNFIRGLPYFCTTLALVEHETVIGGWIFDPTRDELYEASLGDGAYCNGERLKPNWRESFSTGLVGICHSSRLTAQELAGRITGALERGAIFGNRVRLH